MPSTVSQKSIAITRPVGQGEDTAAFVRRLGWFPVLVHTVELRPLERDVIFDQFSRIIAEGPVDWLVFMSTLGVNVFWDMLEAHTTVLSSGLDQVRIMAVGPRTCVALRDRQVKEIFVPENYTSSAIADQLSKFNLQGQRIVLVRSSAADKRLASTLESKGATVETMVTYKAVTPENRESTRDFLAGLEKGRFQAVLFTSAVSSSNLFSMTEKEVSAPELTKLLNSTLVGSIGPTTAAKLRELEVDSVIPGRYLIEDAIELLVKNHESRLTTEALATSEQYKPN